MFSFILYEEYANLSTEHTEASYCACSAQGFLLAEIPLLSVPSCVPACGSISFRILGSKRDWTSDLGCTFYK